MQKYAFCLQNNAFTASVLDIVHATNQPEIDHLH